ncbi:MIT domain-containing protein 1 [Armadillidium vulgare]|nr:MIT domain-containing protein 1 [Armadillidium vulgare]
MFSSKMVSVGSENAAIQVLTRAIQLDSENKYSEAVTCYEQGIRLLLESLKASNDEDKKKHFRKKIDEYLSRAEIMKKASLQEKELSKVHKQIHIKDNETGNSYETLFSFVISETLTSVEIEDAYIRSTHQIYNFLRFCELLVKKAPSLRNIILNTTYSPENLG